MSIKSRQVAGVTSLVVLIVAALSAYYLATLARFDLQESAARGEMLRQAIYQRARDVVPGAEDPYAALEQDGGIRSLLESAVAYSRNVTYAAIVDRNGIAVAHNFRTEEGKPIAEQEDISRIVDRNAFTLLRAVQSDRTYESRQPLLFGDQQFGSIRIGISTLLVKNELQQAFRVALSNILLALIVSTIVAMLLAQWMLRPIHVIQSGLSRLGRGELDVRLELPEGEEFKDLGSSFAAISAQLSESRAKPSQGADLESIVDNLEDAVALFSPDGKPMFSNPAMDALLPEMSDSVRSLVDRTLASRHPQGPITMSYNHGPTDGAPAESTELLLITHPIDDENGHFVGAMLVARNLGFMTQVHSTLNYSRKLAALGRLMAGVAHEVKNPLNAMTIHLELLRNKLTRVPVPAFSGAPGTSGPGLEHAPSTDIVKHVDIISKEITRLDKVLNGFLRFARPDELRLQPLQLDTIISDVVTTITPEAERMKITVRSECPHSLPDVNADAAMLRQALLNLALNACQAMPAGGILRIACRAGARGRVEMDVEDTGVGIAPENLQKIFDLYFTTKETGTGIGLSMVYRIVQLHDGEVEVQSTPGRGTR
ncbi:MAG TPA: ATP-binding protein, partial [Vicinamibacterales bacterium]|nr:ATP-binding protein [Vicinamibacterales bacterium]